MAEHEEQGGAPGARVVGQEPGEPVRGQPPATDAPAPGSDEPGVAGSLARTAASEVGNRAAREVLGTAAGPVGEIASVASGLKGPARQVDAGTDAKEAVGQVATGVAQGAATGALAGGVGAVPGAIIGGVKGLAGWATRSARGRKALLAGVVLAVAPTVLAIVLVVALISSLTATRGLDQVQAERQSASNTAILTDTAMTETVQNNIMSATSGYGVPVEIVTALLMMDGTLQEMVRFTPQAQVPQEARTEAYANNRALVQLLQVAIDAAPRSGADGQEVTLDMLAGTVTGADGSLQVALDPYLAPDAEAGLVDAEKAAKAADTAAAWTVLLAGLPIEGMSGANAEAVYSRALAWVLGRSIGSGRGVCTVSPETGNPATLTSTRGDGAGVSLGEAQIANAATIIGAASAMGSQAQVVALITALQESSLRNLANDGSFPPPGSWPRAGFDTGGQWQAARTEAMRSLTMPNDGAASDWDSVGLFQQRASTGWGSVEELMTPATSVQRFLDALAQVPGWSELEPGAAAQRVQRSAFPLAYTRWVPVAHDLIAQVTGVSCATASATGWAHPVPQGRLTSSYGPRAPIWTTGGWTASFHNGTDLAAPIGTPILAAAAGRVIEVKTTNPMSTHPVYGVSGCLVVLDHGGDTITTYNHIPCGSQMVGLGQIVAAGEQIAVVGASGNVAGPHLHLTVRQGGRTVDPEPFMLARCVDLADPTRVITGCEPPGGSAEAPNAGALTFARQQLGARYVLGATGPDAWDCSSLVQAAYATIGLDLPRTSRQQWDAVTPIDQARAAPGDLVFWSRNGQASGIYHVALYAGSGTVVHAANPTAGVVERTMYTQNLFGFGRVTQGATR